MQSCLKGTVEDSFFRSFSWNRSLVEKTCSGHITVLPCSGKFFVVSVHKCVCEWTVHNIRAPANNLKQPLMGHYHRLEVCYCWVYYMSAILSALASSNAKRVVHVADGLYTAAGA